MGCFDVGKRRVNKEILQKKVASVSNPYHNVEQCLYDKAIKFYDDFCIWLGVLFE